MYIKGTYFAENSMLRGHVNKGDTMVSPLVFGASCNIMGTPLRQNKSLF